ncbi:Bromodomain-containing protein [Canna indica]|uniref:Bromodomain-containing protein n=1 Tax=Canna indica TaxID=4628 RepID=A0AAQ3L3S0_9LILI|nr:Bromodomain-containing protein [Canna indica]
MVSLRKKKQTVIPEGGQRRSARLLALEEQKNEKLTHAMPPVDSPELSDDEEISNRNRRTKKDKMPEFDFPSNKYGNSSNSPTGIQKQTDQTIEYILDMLELKDTKELFSMPYELQLSDYSERVSKPGDFATLRQKHRDGMYTTLEQFESDVYIVFNKAITSNAEDSILYKEAITLNDHAKHVFQSLRNNRTYSELELSTWHQKYFPNKRRATRNDHNSPNYNRGCPQSKDTSRSYSRRGDLAECSKSIAEQRRDTYKPASHSSDVVMALEAPRQLAFNKTGPSYRDSLLHYVRNAGPQAQMAAQQKWMDYNEHAQMPPFMPALTRQNTPNGSSRFHTFDANLPQSIEAGPSYSRPKFIDFLRVGDSARKGGSRMTSFSVLDTSRDDITEVQKGPSCKLETEELLELFNAIGTGESSKSKTEIPESSSKQCIHANRSSFSHPGHGRVQGTAASRSSITGQCSKQQQPFTSIYDLSFWQTRRPSEPNSPVGAIRRAEPEAHAELDLSLWQTRRPSEPNSAVRAMSIAEPEARAELDLSLWQTRRPSEPNSAVGAIRIAEPEAHAELDLSLWQLRRPSEPNSAAGAIRIAEPEARAELDQGEPSTGIMGFRPYAKLRDPFKSSSSNSSFGNKKN